MDEKRSEIQVEPSHYDGLHYDNKSRWISYWHQINEILKLEPNSVLEIGIGNGVVSSYLRKQGIKITTMDIDEQLQPDKVGSVLDIPFPSNAFDVIACFEVLEHLPYEKFKKALEELKRVTEKYVIISVPDVTRVYRFNLELPRSKEIRKLISIPRLKKPVHQFDGQHHWEIGKKGFSIGKVKNDIEKEGLFIQNTFRVYEKPKHRFFILNSKFN